MQPLLLQMANTRYGRELLAIDINVPLSEKIVTIGSNYVQVCPSEHTRMSEFRTAPKYAHVIRHRFKEFEAYRKYLEEKEVRGTRRWAEKLGVPLIAGATVSTITNLSLPVINTEVAHALVSNLKTLIIRNRTKAELKLAFVATESSAKYITLPGGATMELSNLSFTGETIYMQSPKISVVEILELS